MIIYADILIFSNTVIDYILLLITSLIVKQKYNIIRIVVASLLGGFSSLYIFFQNKYVLLNIILKFLIGLLLVLIAFEFKKYGRFLLTYIVFLLLSFCLNGLVVCLQSLDTCVVVNRNFITYFNISPLLLISLTIIFYFLINIVRKILSRKTAQEIVEVNILVLNERLKLKALVDSGHMLTDPLSNSEIIIVDTLVLSDIKTYDKKYLLRKRVIPVSTIAKSGLLDGIRCDVAEIKIKDNIIVLKKPIVVASEQRLIGDYNAIISKTAILGI